LAYKILRSPEIRRDLALVFDFLLQSYITLGDPVFDAFERAVHRIDVIKSDMNDLALAPHQGTLHNDIRPGLRHVTKNRAIFYFHVDDTIRTVRVIAVFFGGQDHQRHMLARLNRTGSS